MNNDKNVEFVNKLIDMTMNNSLSWKHYSDDAIQINDENVVFLHSEFCILDSSKSYYTNLDSHFIILAYETNEDGKDGYITKTYRLMVGESGKHGYISQIKFLEDPYALLSELSYHIMDSIKDTDEKANAFIDAFLNNQIL